jgi:hypothetical protein
MEEEYMKISFSKVVEMVRREERESIRKFYLDKLGKATSDQLDSYIPAESEIMKLFEKI